VYLYRYAYRYLYVCVYIDIYYINMHTHIYTHMVDTYILLLSQADVPSKVWKCTLFVRNKLCMYTYYKVVKHIARRVMCILQRGWIQWWKTRSFSPLGKVPFPWGPNPKPWEHLEVVVKNMYFLHYKKYEIIQHYSNKLSIPKIN
jgi:hypothetical protein